MEVADSWPRESDASVRPAGEGERPQRQRRGGGRWAALGQGSDAALPAFAHRGVGGRSSGGDRGCVCGAERGGRGGRGARPGGTLHTCP